MRKPPKLKHDCWIHDSAEDYGADTCDLCYWRCPECGAGMRGEAIGNRQGEGSRLFQGVWRCPACDTYIDFATMKATGEHDADCPVTLGASVDCAPVGECERRRKLAMLDPKDGGKNG